MLIQRSKEWWDKFLKDVDDNPEPDVPYGILAISPELLQKMPEHMRNRILKGSEE